MARTPLLLNPKFLLQNLRDGFDAAKARTGHEGGLIALSAGGLILAFFLLALLAPLALNAPGIVSYGAGAFVLLLVLASTGAGAVALWRLMAAGAREGGGARVQATTIINDAAIQDAQDAMTGRVQGLAMAAVQSGAQVFLVIRLKQAVPLSLIFAPKAAPWPFALPPDGTLTPVPAPGGVDGLAWATDRDPALLWSARLGPALAMSAAGGEAPFLSLRAKALVLRWDHGDVGTAALIGRELCLAIAKA